MPAAEALAVVQAAHPGRDVTAQAVYAYWRGRRLAAKKPLLRRLQAPTSASDSNPMLVFRWGPALMPAAVLGTGAKLGKARVPSVSASHRQAFCPVSMGYW